MGWSLPEPCLSKEVLRDLRRVTRAGKTGSALQSDKLNARVVEISWRVFLFASKNLRML
jgi:hypothetical protein